MVEEILTASGVPFRRSRYTRPPGGKTYAVYMDDVTTDGPDGQPSILRHDITVEMYASKPDPAAETAMEGAISAAGLQWVKQDRYWLQSEQLYQIIYEFYYFEKKGAK